MRAQILAGCLTRTLAAGIGPSIAVFTCPAATALAFVADPCVEAKDPRIRRDHEKTLQSMEVQIDQLRYGRVKALGPFGQHAKRSEREQLVLVEDQAIACESELLTAAFSHVAISNHFRAVHVHTFRCQPDSSTNLIAPTIGDNVHVSSAYLTAIDIQASKPHLIGVIAHAIGHAASDSTAMMMLAIASATSKEFDRTLTVTVTNHSPLLNSAQVEVIKRQVGAIFADIGVRVVYVERDAVAVIDLVAVMPHDCDVYKNSAEDLVAGCALSYRGQFIGGIAFMDTKAIKERELPFTGRLFGKAIAHELGHLLRLEDGEGGARGIMSGNAAYWNPETPYSWNSTEARKVRENLDPLTARREHQSSDATHFVKPGHGIRRVFFIEEDSSRIANRPTA